MMGKGDIRSGDLEAFLGKNTSFEGKMSFEGMVRLDGRFEGEIFSEDVLIIGEEAVANAKIKVGTLLVDGKVTGNVHASDKIEIHSTGELIGDIKTAALVIREGGVFDGICKMDKGAEEAARKVTPLKEREADEMRAVDLLDEG